MTSSLFAWLRNLTFLGIVTVLIGAFLAAPTVVTASCSSSGCFAMTDQNVAEIYAIARDALADGQCGFQV